MNSTAVRAADTLQKMTHLPPSFDNSPVLYGLALMSVMSITFLSLAVAGWMVRDIWRDRFSFHPNTLVFKFREMIILICATAFVRCFPEMLYLQMYGDPDVSAVTQGYIMTFKRALDGSALWFVLGWLGIFVAIYPPMIVALKSHPARTVEIDMKASWPRLLPSAVVSICIIAVAATFAYAKVSQAS